MSNGRVECRHTIEDRILLRFFKDLPPSVHLHPDAVNRLDEQNQDILDLAELAPLQVNKKLVFLPEIRTSVAPPQTRASRQDYLSLFVDIFSIGYGLSCLGAAHFCKILLEELVEHFLPDDFPIDREDFSWMSFKNAINLGS